jgi:hypothetical protein
MGADGRRSFYSMLKSVFFFTAFLFVCFASVLYVAGNLRDFTERTQFFLLNVIVCAGLFTAFCTLLDFLFNAGAALVKRKERSRRRSFIFLIIGVVAFIFSCVAALIIAFTRGNIG